MKKSSELKRYNIKPIRELTKEEIQFIATEITKKMEKMLLDAEFDGNHIYDSILNAKMMLADIPEKFTDVNYLFSTNTIYIRGEENISKIDPVLLHEIFHYIQCNQDNNFEGELEQMGLCKFHAYKISGLAINEAAIQLIISIVFGNEQKKTNYWGLTIESIENNYYPLLCALLQQITYILGYKELLESMLKNTDSFKDAFENLAGKRAYDFLRDSFDTMMQSRDKISEIKRTIDTVPDRKKKILERQISIYIKEIQNRFIGVQRLCYTEYFKPLFKKCKNKEDLEDLEEKIEEYHKHTGKLAEKDDFMIYSKKELKKLKSKIK